MNKQHKKHHINGFELSHVRNRNEQRVITCMKSILENLGNPELPEKILCDVYAYSLNNLPARYTQCGSIVLRDPVKKDNIEQVVTEALQRVLKNPKL